MAIDFNYFLQQKYSQLQQQANADTTRAGAATTEAAAQTQNAASTAISANANALASGAAARLDTTRAAVLPGQVASESALQGAQARLYGTQASVLPAASASENLLRSAQTGLTGSQTRTSDYLRTTGVLGGAAGSVPSLSSGQPDAISDTLVRPFVPSSTAASPTAQQPGETYGAWRTRLAKLYPTSAIGGS